MHYENTHTHTHLYTHTLDMIYLGSPSAPAQVWGATSAALRTYSCQRACYICLRSGWGSDGNVYNVLPGLRDFGFRDQRFAHCARGLRWVPSAMPYPCACAPHLWKRPSAGLGARLRDSRILTPAVISLSLSFYLSLSIHIYIYIYIYTYISLSIHIYTYIYT